MANREKYTRAAIGHMTAHYERKKDKKGNYYKFGNQDIDPARSVLNYNLAADDQPMPQKDFVEKRIKDLHCLNRKNVNVMMSWLVTLPQNLNDKDLQEKRKFFEKSYEFLKARYGAENVISAYVHMDETQPHMHFAWTPVLFDEKKQAYRFNAKVVGSRNDLQTFHDQFDTYMTQQMGYVTGVRNGITEINMSINELKAIQKKMSKIDEQIAQNAPQSLRKGKFGYKSKEVDTYIQHHENVQKRLYLTSESKSVMQKANEGLEIELKKAKLSNSAKSRKQLEQKVVDLTTEVIKLKQQNQAFENQIKDLQSENKELKANIEWLKDFVYHTIDYFKEKFHEYTDVIEQKLTQWFTDEEFQVIGQVGYEQDQYLADLDGTYDRIEQNNEFKLWCKSDEYHYVLTDTDNEPLLEFDSADVGLREFDDIDLDSAISLFEEKMNRNSEREFER